MSDDPHVATPTTIDKLLAQVGTWRFSIEYKVNGQLRWYIRL